VVYLLSVYLGGLFGAVLGALLGFGLQQVTSQDGWALVVGSLGACLGAFSAGMRRADGLPIWRIRTPRSGTAAPPDNAG
jgi:hypothetical protein